MKRSYLWKGGLLLFLLFALAACQQAPGPAVTEDAAAVTQVPCPTAAPCPDCPTCPAEPVVDVVPFQEAWVNSPHADADSEAFRHWDEEDPQEIPAQCARCHSTPGYLDYLGVDGTAFHQVDNAAPIGTVIECQACHNQVAGTLDAVVFPSGIELAGLGPSARCMECHQGRSSVVQVNSAIENAGLTEDLDTPSEDLRFVNIHYYAAAATLYGTQVKGGYEYSDRAYVYKFEHVEEYDTCAECHNPHTLEIRIEGCTTCHEGVASVEDLRNIRMQGSMLDYDGDGEIAEGIYYEIETLQQMLMQAMQAYASSVVGTPIAYDEHSHPYFFIDTNENGVVDEDEATSSNGYNAFTGRLLQAAYNYQVSLKDPGNYAHNGKYIIQLLYDSIDVLNEALGSQAVDLSRANRNDPGHFASFYEAWRHWDEEGIVEATCVRCHTAEGLPMFIENGATISIPPSTNLSCTTCHTNIDDFTLYEVAEVEFPSGEVLGFQDNPQGNLCMTCHQGRESTRSVDAAINRVGVGDDQASEALSFRNPHYFAAGATLFGSEAHGAYEYEGREYNGRFDHIPPFDSCVECHDPHALTIQVNTCVLCHPGVETQEDLRSIRLDPDGEGIDYDGDGDPNEGIAFEIETMHNLLFEAILEYSQRRGTPLAYNPARYPYWFNDLNGNGQVDPDEASNDNRFVSWTPNLLRAAYNYTWVAKDPGAFAHNNEYVLQFLYDSIDSIGDASGLTRPPVNSGAGVPVETETAEDGS